MSPESPNGQKRLYSNKTGRGLTTPSTLDLLSTPAAKNVGAITHNFENHGHWGTLSTQTYDGPVIVRATLHQETLSVQVRIHLFCLRPKKYALEETPETQTHPVVNFEPYTGTALYPTSGAAHIPRIDRCKYWLNISNNKNECEFFPRSQECDSLPSKGLAKAKQKPRRALEKAKKRPSKGQQGQVKAKQSRGNA